MTSPLIKIGMTVSYDYAFLYNSLPLVYEHADQITLAVDQSCRTWTGIQFAIADSFWDWVKQIDTHNKIAVYRDNFYLPELDALANDTRERNLLAKQMGPGGWHVQVDSDEYFLDFGSFARFLRRHARWTAPGQPPIDIGAFLIPLFQKTDDGFIYVEDAFETFVIATNFPDYKQARKSDHFIRYTPYCLFHQTWARTEKEVWVKANSFGHIANINVQSYFNLWKSIDRNNYRFVRDCHPLIPEVWHRLAWGPGKDIPEFIHHYGLHHPGTAPFRTYLCRRLGQYRKLMLSRYGRPD